jgi:uncharacterized sulfatase
MPLSSALTRRAFAGAATSGAVLRGAQTVRPNILWITCEDTGPQLGCYGDGYADTPNLDRLAARGLSYRYAWSNAPVCAPARTAIISGVYPTSTGSEHMRSLTNLPANMRMYPQLLREAGYYATNNSKEDYNLDKPGQVWDESSARAHWRKRASGQPFFSIFNFTITHESQLRTRPHTWIHDPAKARVPAYHPDTLETRQDWAQYYDNITTMDRQAGEVLAQLEQDGLAKDTIVFFYGDHGSGMPRSKRWPYNSGLHVPMIVHIPEKFRHLAPKDYAPGGKSDRMVSFVDLAPTLLSLIGVRPPEWMQGSAFLGAHPGPESQYLYGFRGRMDERYDLVRSVRDRRYVYIRNFMPHRIYGQHLAYMFETPTTRVWKKLYDEGKLNAAQSRFWQPKPAEELYDLQADPDEINNLADSKQHRDVLLRMRAALDRWMADVRDVGFLPEDEIHTRSRGSTPYEAGHDEKRYPLKRALETAHMASLPGAYDSALAARLKDADSAVRYWAATGLLIRGRIADRTALLAALEDASPSVRVPSAELLARHARAADRSRALSTLVALANLESNSVYTVMLALNAIDNLGSIAAPVMDQVRKLPATAPNMPARTGEGYVKRLLEHLTAG